MHGELATVNCSCHSRWFGCVTADRAGRCARVAPRRGRPGHPKPRVKIPVGLCWACIRDLKNAYRGLRRYLGVLMELDWVDKSQKSGRQAIPVVLAVMVGFCGIGLPLTDAMYVPAFIAAIVFAVATPLALIVAAPEGLFRRTRAFRWLSIACAFSAACAVAASGILMSFGTPAGAAGDIGGFPMWLLSTIALVTVTSCAIRVWRVEYAAPPTTLSGFQRQERRAKRS